ncbi:hypothetical protein ACOCJ5_04045 [Knoellia sp. CPCC 206450]|uniref:hypothetical protein n=1 Tax=Knoellia tibetensis TaxID=3404798 RepID=UPI003B428C32
MGELLDACAGFIESETHGFAPLLDAIERAMRTCMRNEILLEEFPTAFAPFSAHLTTLTTGISGLGSSTQAKRAYLSARITALVAQVKAFELIVNDTGAGYREALVMRLSAAVAAQGPFTTSDARKLQSLATHMCAFLLTQGRSGVASAKLIARALGSANTPQLAAVALGRFLSSDRVEFRVAVVIDGVGLVLNANNNGLKPLVKGRRISWGQDGDGCEHHGADTELARFCLRHWHLESVEESLKGARASSSVFTVSVQAWDPESARHAALNIADSVVDLLNAEHRATSFGVKRKVLVWRVGSAKSEYLAGRANFVAKGRLMDISRSPSVSRSLRFATKASMERAGTLKVFFSWVALEYLAREGRDKPQNIVVEKVPKIIALVAVKQQVYRSWALYTKSVGASQKVRDAVEAGRGKGSVDARIWCNILTSTRSDLGGVDAEVVREYVRSSAQFSPYVLFRLRSTRELLSNGERLATFCAEVEELARFNLQRMRYVRNQTAHSAEIEHAAESQLSVVALLALDATFESVPKWHSIATVEALDRLHARYRNSLADWRRSSRGRQKPNLQIELILRP